MRGSSQRETRRRVERHADVIRIPEATKHTNEVIPLRRSLCAGDEGVLDILQDGWERPLHPDPAVPLPRPPSRLFPPPRPWGQTLPVPDPNNTCGSLGDLWCLCSQRWVQALEAGKVGQIPNRHLPPATSCKLRASRPRLPQQPLGRML